MITILNLSIDSATVAFFKSLGIKLESVEEKQVEKSRQKDAKKMGVDAHPGNTVHAHTGRNTLPIVAEQGCLGFDNLASELVAGGARIVVTTRKGQFFKGKLMIGMGSPVSESAAKGIRKYLSQTGYQKVFVFWNSKRATDPDELVTVNPSGIITKSKICRQILHADCQKLIVGAKWEWDQEAGE